MGGLGGAWGGGGAGGLLVCARTGLRACECVETEGQGRGGVEGLETPITATNYSSQTLTDCSRPNVLKAQTRSSKSSRHSDQLVTGSVMASFF